MQQHITPKGPPNFFVPKQHLKHHKSSKNPSAHQKISVKTSVQQRLKKTEEFLKPQKYEKGLAKSAQQPGQKHLFKNSQIKKSIELHKNQFERIMEKEKHEKKSVTSDQKYNRDAYYGNTTTSQTKSNKKSSKSKLSEISKHSSTKIALKNQKQSTVRKQGQSFHQNTLRSPPVLVRKKQTSVKKKEQKRLKKIEQEYVKMLEEKLEQREAELNTIKTRNMLEETKGFGGWADGLNEEEMRRLRKIHRTEEEIFELEINEIRREILSICEKQRNEVLCFGGYECEDVLSFIQGKD